MRAADAIELADAQQVRGGERFGRGLGRDDDNASNARDLRGDGRHQQRGRKRMAAAGHIAADRSERANELSGGQARDRRALSTMPATGVERIGGSELPPWSALRGGRVESASHAAAISSRVTRNAAGPAQPIELAMHSGEERDRLFGARRRRCACTAGNTESSDVPLACFKRCEAFAAACSLRLVLWSGSVSSLCVLDYSTTLFKRIFDDAVALAALSRGMTSRAVRSSTMVLTATHSGSLSCETVGEFSAGRHRENCIEIGAAAR